jgi:hypothetical protein
MSHHKNVTDTSGIQKTMSHNAPTADDVCGCAPEQNWLSPKRSEVFTAY